MLNENQSHPLSLLGITTGLFLLIISPQFLSEGMFMDGTYYATIARNLAEGIGSFWKPHLTDAVGPVFKDHPPLAFGLESLWFSIFGDYSWVERAYSLFCYILSSIIIIGIWKSVSSIATKVLYFLPLLLWMTVPKMTWTVSNNLIENTMMVFVLGSIYFSIQYTLHKNILSLFLSGLFIFFGVLTKGVVALFPFSFLFFYFLLEKPFSFINMLKSLSIQVIGFLTPVLFVYFFLPEGIKAFSDYIEIQLIGSLNNEQTVDSRFFILRKSVEESLVMIALAALSFWFAYRKNQKAEKQSKYSLVILLTAYSGIVPIVVSLKQSTFYINASFPLIAVAIGLFIAPKIIPLFTSISTKQWKILKVTSILLVLLGIWACLSQLNTLRRDKEKLQDIHAILEQIPEGIQIFQTSDIHREWSLHGYFYRYGYVSLFWTNPEHYPYMIRPKNSVDPIPAQYKLVPLTTKTLDLYQNQAYTK